MLRLAAVAVVAGALATGCTGSPAPTPSTPTPLSDDEAFAAAEATYRAYVDALNQVDLGDPETFEPVYALTTGDANAAARKSFTQMSADGWVVSGESKVVGIKPATRDTEAASVDVCVDVSEVSLTGKDGSSQVSPDRPPIQALRVTVEVARDDPAIQLFTPLEVEDVCG